MIDSAVMEIAHIKSVVGSKSVCIDDAVGFHALLDDGQQGLSFGIGDDGRKNLSTPFKKAENRNFARSAPASLAFAHSSKIALICFNFSR